MKRLIVIITILLPSFTFCQKLTDIQKQIDSISLVNVRINSKVKFKNDSILALQSKIIEIKAGQEKVTPFYYYLDERIKILTEQFVLSDILTWVEKGDSILVLNFGKDYFIVHHGIYTGFVHYNSLPKTDALNNFRESALMVQFNNENDLQERFNIQKQLDLLHEVMKQDKAKSELDERIKQRLRKEDELAREELKIQKEKEEKQKVLLAQEEEKQKKLQTQIVKRQNLIHAQKAALETKSRRELIFQKYKSIEAQKILDKDIWIGMTSAMAIDSRGAPYKINRTVNKYGTSEQWVYGSTYLYFENNILKSWQE